MELRWCIESNKVAQEQIEIYSENMGCSLEEEEEEEEARVLRDCTQPVLQFKNFYGTKEDDFYWDTLDAHIEYRETERLDLS